MGENGCMFFGSFRDIATGCPFRGENLEDYPALHNSAGELITRYNDVVKDGTQELPVFSWGIEYRYSCRCTDADECPAVVALRERQTQINTYVDFWEQKGWVKLRHLGDCFRLYLFSKGPKDTWIHYPPDKPSFQGGPYIDKKYAMEVWREIERRWKNAPTIAKY